MPPGGAYGQPQGGPYAGGPQPGYGGPPPGQGYQPQGPAAPQQPSKPGLFDLSFTSPVAPRIAKLGLIALWVFAGLTALAGLAGFISAATLDVGPWGGGGGMVFAALVEMLASFALAVAIVVLGRMGIELVLAVVEGREEARKKSEAEE